MTQLTTLQHALKMVVNQIPDEDASADQVTMSSYATTGESQIAGLMRKECTSIRKRKRDMFDTDTLEVLFLGDKNLLALIQAWVKDTLTEQEQLTTRR
jgi:hypothetical protein